MNFEFAELINPSLEEGDYSNAVNIAEIHLKNIPVTGFHAVLGHSLLHHTESLVNWISNFYKIISKKTDIKALYFEMNEFDINTDTWYIDGFAYALDGGHDLDDMEWLSEVTQGTMTNDSFILKGYEELQKAFENIEADSENLEDARDWCEQIIIARFMELMRAAHKKAKEKNLKWAVIPIYYTEHSYDFILKSEN